MLLDHVAAAVAQLLQDDSAPCDLFILIGDVSSLGGVCHLEYRLLVHHHDLDTVELLLLRLAQFG